MARRRWTVIQKTLIVMILSLFIFQFLLFRYYSARERLGWRGLGLDYIQQHLSEYRPIFDYLKSINVTLMVLNKDLLTSSKNVQPMNFVTFGLFDRDRETLKNSVIENFPNSLITKWRFREHRQIDYRIFGLLKVPVNVSAHFSFYTNLHILHLAVLLERSNYWWISEFTDHEFSRILVKNSTNVPLPMAIEKFQCADEVDKFFCFPSDISYYLWQLQHAKFLECPYEEVVWKFEDEFPLAKIDTVNYGIAYGEIMRISRKLRKPVLLAYGSLLGWYRQCDFIVHSKDLDVQMFLHDFDHEFFTELFSSKILKLHNRMGNTKDGLSFRTYLIQDRTVWMDLFTMHPHETGYYLYVWHKGLFKLHRYQYPPMSRICSTELLGVLVYLPCTPLTYIEAEYGTNGWYDPKLYTYINLKTVKLFPNLETMMTYIHVYVNMDCENPSVISGCDNVTDQELVY